MTVPHGDESDRLLDQARINALLSAPDAPTRIIGATLLCIKASLAGAVIGLALGSVIGVLVIAAMVIAHA